MSLVKLRDPSDVAVAPFSFGKHAAASPAATASTGSGNAPSSLGDPARSIAKEDSLLDRIAELESALAATQARAETARAEAYQTGLEEGRKSAEMQRAEAVSLLRDAILAGRDTLDAHLDGQLETAITLTRAILQQILGDPAAIKDHIVLTAQRWKQELAGSSIIRLRVSPLDFPDREELQALEQAVRGTGVECDPSLESGACLFDLKLGTLEASPSRQLANAQDFLTRAQSEGTLAP